MSNIVLKQGFSVQDFRSHKKIRVRKGELLLYEGDHHRKNCFLILKGRLEVRLITGTGHETLLYHLLPGELVGELAMFGFLTRTATVLASENTELLEISHTEFSECIQKHDFLQRITSLFIQRYIHTHEVVCRLGQPNISMKLCRYVKTLADQFDDQETVVRVRLPSHAELARLLSCQRETITREIKKLVQAQVIIPKQNQVEIHRERMELFLSGMLK